jgi:hypothetical protein
MERTTVPRQASPIDDLKRKHYQLLAVIYQRHTEELTILDASLADYWRRRQTGSTRNG